jgi:hypothetical protein
MSQVIDHAVEVFGRFHLPASLAYTGASLFAFMKAVPAKVHEMTVVEAIVRISESALLQIAPVLGGIGLLMGGYLSFVLRREKQRADIYKKLIEAGHKVPIDLVFDTKFPFDRKGPSKPSEDTVDVP